ncbi:MAG: hypothetical protein JNM66_04555 [Bryobacterales bacterium]|nr:hypothetical protein [Bryobacterales bacterium]
MAADTKRGAIAVPGGLATIFGAELAESAQAAAGYPLPTALGGVSITVGGIPAPLLYVSPNQVNFQVPSRIVSPTVPIVVKNRAGESRTILASVSQDAPGLFTQSGSGCGQGAILNVAADGSVQVNSPQSSASPGQYITIFGTGLGTPAFPPADGFPAGRDPFSWISYSELYLGPPTSTAFLRKSYLGLAPGMVGVAQFNVVLPEDAPEGCAIPIWIRGVTVDSQPVAISIRRGGGACLRSALARSAKLSWKRTVTTGLANESTAEEAEVFTASFQQGESSWLSPEGAKRIGVWTGLAAGRTVFEPPRCGSFIGANVSGGRLSIQSAAGASLPIEPLHSATGEYVYRATLPKGTVAPGSLTVEGAGGETVGPFRTSVSPPSPIEVLTDLRPGTAISSGKPLTISWRNGRPGDLVRVQIRTGATVYSGYTQDVPAEIGTVTLDTIEPLPGLVTLPLNASNGFSVVVSHIPGRPAAFRALGMTFDGTHEWEYEFQFLGLRLLGTTEPI